MASGSELSHAPSRLFATLSINSSIDAIPRYTIHTCTLFLLGEPDGQKNDLRTSRNPSEAEKKRTGLVTIGKRSPVIDGDPQGLWYRWAGNIAHPQHPHLVTYLVLLNRTILITKVVQGAVLEPIFKGLIGTKFAPTQASHVSLTCLFTSPMIISRQWLKKATFMATKSSLKRPRDYWLFPSGPQGSSPHEST